MAGPLGTNGSMTEDTPGLETRGVRFDPRHLDFQLFIHQMICPAREAACEPLASCSASPAKLGQNAKLSHSRPDRVSVEKLSLVSCSSTCTGATHRNSSRRAPGLSFYLLRC